MRFAVGGGLGYAASKADRGRLDLIAGLACNREKFSPPAPAVRITRNSAEAYWAVDAGYTFGDPTSLAQGFRMFNNLPGEGAFRMSPDIGAKTSLSKSLTWNLSLSDCYLSNPAPRRTRKDLLYTTGFGITFTR